MKTDVVNFLHAEKTLTPKSEALKKACKDFESVFTYELLKSMRATIDKVDLAPYEDFKVLSISFCW